MIRCMGCMREYNEMSGVCPSCGYSDDARMLSLRENPDLLPPETILINRFIIGRDLSVSDFSVVYIAWDALLERRVAVRELYPYDWCERVPGRTELHCRDASKRMMFDALANEFENECLQWNRNQEIPGVVNIYRTFRANQTVYAVMEYLSGITLQDLLDEGPVPGVRVRQIVQNLGYILDQIHNRYLAHLNLTPDNIYLDENDQITLIDFGKTKRRVKLMDSGASEMLDERYCAPEIWSDQLDEAAADMYSLGAVFYRMIAGKEPSARSRGNLAAGGASEKRMMRLLTETVPAKRPGSYAKLAERMSAGM